MFLRFEILWTWNRRRLTQHYRFLFVQSMPCQSSSFDMGLIYRDGFNYSMSNSVGQHNSNNTNRGAELRAGSPSMGKTVVHSQSAELFVCLHHSHWTGLQWRYFGATLKYGCGMGWPKTNGTKEGEKPQCWWVGEVNWKVNFIRLWGCGCPFITCGIRVPQELT